VRDSSFHPQNGRKKEERGGKKEGRKEGKNEALGTILKEHKSYLWGGCGGLFCCPLEDKLKVRKWPTDMELVLDSRGLY
jgi:hypothetical protein